MAGRDAKNKKEITQSNPLYHLYTDDLQIYISFNPLDVLKAFRKPQYDINRWVSGDPESTKN